MIKRIIILFLLMVAENHGYSQSKQVLDRLRHELSIAGQDTNRVRILWVFTSHYQANRPDSALYYGYKSLALARKINYPYGEVRTMASIGIAYNVLGNFSKSIQIELQAIQIADENNNFVGKSVVMSILSDAYRQVKDYEKALTLLKESRKILDSLPNMYPFSIVAQTSIGRIFLEMNQVDSAEYYCQLAYKNAVKLKNPWGLTTVLSDLGEIENKKENTELALGYFRRAITIDNSDADLCKNYFSIAQIYKQINKTDSCIFFARKSLEIAQKGGFYSSIIDANILLSRAFETSDPSQALQYNKKALLFKDSLYNMGKLTALQSFSDFDKQERQYEIEKAETTYRNKVQRMWIFSIVGALISAIIIALVLYRNNKNKQKANAALKEQKEEIQSTLEKLKSTQSQLIQSEKMASLGELTAGIAHEIQNPLNFVNNFSEVNTEMVDEAKDEMDKKNYDEVTTILNDIKDNSEKINHHGKRADAIVKSMLEHSRTSTGVKEPTDINKLADEYLRLAYHGLQAKDKEFNAELKTDFDESIGKINIIPQDIGRVLLNLYNNAFYACAERSRSAVNARLNEPFGQEEKSKNSVSYEPTVSLSTKKEGDRVTITVKDNGSGIPEKIKEKIFQPFFTTKPTGLGTGLGLSLSYDIIKAHGGEIKVKSKDGEGLPVEQSGTEFIIQLPLN